MRRKLLAAGAATSLVLIVCPVAAARDTPAQLAGQRVVFAFDGTRPPDDLLARIRRREVGGVILFSRNITGPAQLARLTRRLQAARPPGDRGRPLPIMVDEEGGLVRRVPGAPAASARALGRRGVEVAERVGRRTGARLRALGVNVNLAPVADVARPGSVIERQRRAFSRDRERVADHAAAYARGLRRAGVAATGKHFPGFGPARRTTDEVPVSLDIATTTLRRIDGAPWTRLIAADVPLAMLSTAVYPRLDRRPAALSGAIATVELRRRRGFRGVSISDALDTPALAGIGPRATALAAARAGTDLLIYANSYGAGVRAANTLTDAIADGRIRRRSALRSRARIAELRRLLRTRDGLRVRAAIRQRLDAAAVFAAVTW